MPAKLTVIQYKSWEGEKVKRLTRAKSNSPSTKPRRRAASFPLSQIVYTSLVCLYL